MPKCIIHVLNGPNLNLLGEREPGLYGSLSLSDIESMVRAQAEVLDATIIFRQSNHEGDLVSWIQETAKSDEPAGLIINPAAYTHTSVALRDAIVASKTPCIEVHLSNIHSREEFRHKSYISGVSLGVICGLGAEGYLHALSSMVSHLAGNT